MYSQSYPKNIELMVIAAMGLSSQLNDNSHCII